MTSHNLVKSRPSPINKKQLAWARLIAPQPKNGTWLYGMNMLVTLLSERLDALEKAKKPPYHIVSELTTIIYSWEDDNNTMYKDITNYLKKNGFFGSRIAQRINLTVSTKCAIRAFMYQEYTSYLLSEQIITPAARHYNIATDYIGITHNQLKLALDELIDIAESVIMTHSVPLKEIE